MRMLLSSRNGGIASLRAAKETQQKLSMACSSRAPEESAAWRFLYSSESIRHIREEKFFEYNRMMREQYAQEQYLVCDENIKTVPYL